MTVCFLIVICGNVGKEKAEPINNYAFGKQNQGFVLVFIKQITTFHMT